MQFRPLGRTGLNLSWLCFGASSLGQEFRTVDLQEAMRSVRTALDLGMNTLQNTMLTDLVPYLKENGVRIMNAAPFSARLLTNSALPSWHKATPEVRALCRKAAELCGSRGVDLAQLAVQFSLANPDLTTCVVRSANPVNVQNWVKWADQPLDTPLVDEVLAILQPIHNWFYIEGRPENNDRPAK
ncbi:MAG: hypothetical protein EXS05_07275 [Planctomycetaceae bacterium]|nr:hypothetical protein [Planctomycetaceae bacterium]